MAELALVITFTLILFSGAGFWWSLAIVGALWLGYLAVKSSE